MQRRETKIIKRVKNYSYRERLVKLSVTTFANGLGDLGSVAGRVIPKTQKMLLDTSLLNTQHYKVRIKAKVEQFRERSSTPPLDLGVVAIEKGAFGSPSTKVTNFTYFTLFIIMSCRQHGYPRPSLATSLYHSSPPAGLQGYILYLHIAAVCKFKLVVLFLLGHMCGSIGVQHLRARPCFSSSVLRVWFV